MQHKYACFLDITSTYLSVIFYSFEFSTVPEADHCEASGPEAEDIVLTRSSGWGYQTPAATHVLY